MLSPLLLHLACAANTTTAPQRLAQAVAVASEHLTASTYSVLKCPKDQAVGYRPPQHTHDKIGTTCEPWMARGALMVLDFFLDPRMRGLEWSAGSSTVWTLRRLKHLHSVEHNLVWTAQLQQQLKAALPQLLPKWTLAAVPCKDLQPGACALNDGQSEGAGTDYTDYVRTPVTSFRAHFPFDYILVDGRARTQCLSQVLHDTPGMLVENGLLVRQPSNARAPLASDT